MKMSVTSAKKGSTVLVGGRRMDCITGQVESDAVDVEGGVLGVGKGHDL